jgi:hypothetical protein
MRNSSAKKIIALLALLLCQLTVIAHTAQHESLQLDDSCVICLHAPGLNAGAVAPAMQVVICDAQHDIAVVFQATRPETSFYRHSPIRGPPHLIA